MELKEIMDLAPNWLETIGCGFPSGGVGEQMQEQVRSSVSGLQPEIVAEVQGLPLTTIHVQATIGFAEVLAGNAFADDERAYLREVILGDFLTDPVAALGSLQQIVVALSQIPSMDPETRAVQRMQAHTTSKVVELAAGSRTPLLEIVERYNPIVAVDTEAARVVTADAVEAFQDLVRLVGVAAGVADPDDAGLDISDLLERYGAAGPIVRAELAGTRRRWVALRRTMRAMGESDLARLRSIIESRVSAADEVFAAVVGFGMASGIMSDARRLAREYEERRRRAERPHSDCSTVA